jgi:1-acyl-sn-glycerol-3-phosphate acyltransferase
MAAGSSSETLEEARFLNASALGQAELRRLANATADDRLKTMVSVPVSAVQSKDILAVQPMSFFGQAACILFLAFGVPNGAITIPLCTYLVGRFLVGNVAATFAVLGVLMLPLAVIPHDFAPSVLQSWLAVQLLHYFSFRVVHEERLPTRIAPSQSHNGSGMNGSRNGNESRSDGGTSQGTNADRPYIIAASPHGVFPYGNILAMIVWPSLTGHPIAGLAASAALRAPIFRQILGSIGAVEASRPSARMALERYPYTIGLSPGGVAEVFETNARDECILLRERRGMIKLAIQTGSDLVPCYMFGNTKLYSCWVGEGIPGARSFLEWISRRVLGFAVLGVLGRFGLAIPYRIPILCVIGKAVPTRHLQCEEPTMEQVHQVQKKFLKGMQELFDKHKALYGWQDKKLTIK